jgi:flagellar assembly protein FliH
MSDAGAGAVRWVPPEVSGPVANRRRELDAAESDATDRRAWQVGYDEGLAQGRAAADEEQAARLRALDQQVARLDAILVTLVRPLAELDMSVERELAELACAIARQVVRRELRTEPAHVIGAIREAVALLPAAARDVRVLLHPEDAALVRERLVDSGAARVWAITEDPMMGRGGCRVVAEDSTIDARLETRVGAVIALVLGDERATAEPEELRP